jgi:hypothetical protein
MMDLLWFLPLVVGLVSMWSVQLQGLAVLVALICGLIGLIDSSWSIGGYPFHATKGNETRRRPARPAPRGRWILEPPPAGFKTRRYQAPGTWGRRESRL